MFITLSLSGWSLLLWTVFSACPSVYPSMCYNIHMYLIGMHTVHNRIQELIAPITSLRYRNDKLRMILILIPTFKGIYTMMLYSYHMSNGSDSTTQSSLVVSIIYVSRRWCVTVSDRKSLTCPAEVGAVAIEICLTDMFFIRLQTYALWHCPQKLLSDECNRILTTVKSLNIRHTLAGCKIADHSDVVGASPVGAAPTTSSFSTEHLASLDWEKTTARRGEKHLSIGIWWVLY